MTNEPVAGVRASEARTRHFLSLKQLSPAQLAHVVRRSAAFAAAGRFPGRKPLADRTVGIFFRGSSTRTRTSFTVGAQKLGAQTLSYGPQDLQLATGETLEDTGRVLSCYLDALVIRTNSPQAEMEALARQDRMAIINAMSAEEHPTQAIADLSTLLEARGSLEGVHLLYLGEGNNSVTALANGFARIPGSRLTVVTPEGYGVPEALLAPAQETGRQNGSVIEQHHDVDDLPSNVDAVYATRWQTMGVPKADPDWRRSFLPYTVDQRIMERVSKPQGTIFLHDLPAVRGDDVTDEVLDGPQSYAWRQAEHKMFGAMAVLEWCLGGEELP
jgi:ornithine carbamoyltransferase